MPSAKSTRCPHGPGATSHNACLPCRESGAATAHGVPALGEGASRLPGSSRPWADTDETAGNSIRGTVAQPAASRVGGTGPGFSRKAGGCCLKSKSETRSDRASPASSAQRPGQHQHRSVSAQRPQLTLTLA